MGTCITMTFTIVDAKKSTHIPGTQYCIYNAVRKSLLANATVFIGFDTFVFVAISYKIASFHLDVEAGVGWVTAFSGKVLPRVSQAILRGGQQYYLITLSLQLPVLVLTAIPDTLVPISIKFMLTFPLGALASSMVCRIFRNTKLNDVQTWQPGSVTLSDVGFVHSNRETHGQGTVLSLPHGSLEPQSLQRPIAVTLPQKKASSGAPLSMDDV
ncbi:hypothetical protein AN958_02328 [Leucoagaricus sp. SymC.cos]|nr:hypothetical protein AN958_02328 [Leucoagaricus sp. SymC.cos]